MHLNKTLVLCLALVAGWAIAPRTMAAGSGTNAGDKISSLFGDPVLARGTGVEIKRSELDAAVLAVKTEAKARGQTLPAESALEPQVLQNLIKFRLLLHKATEADRSRGRELFLQSIEKLKKRAGVTDEEFNERIERQMKLLGQTREQWEKQGGDQATAQAVAERELKVSVSDDDAKKYYDEHPTRFEEPEMVRASHILLSTRDSAGQALSEEKKADKRKQAEDLLKRARAGEDFAKLADEFSEDPGSKGKGGEYKFPRGVMDPNFESAAFSLNTNQISDIVTTPLGYHIIKLSEKIPANQVPFTKVAEDLKDGLRQREIQKLLPEYMDKLLQGSDVQILDEQLKPAKTDSSAGAAAAQPGKAGEVKNGDK